VIFETQDSYYGFDGSVNLLKTIPAYNRSTSLGLVDGVVSRLRAYHI
jgi:hypothetical protein